MTPMAARACRRVLAHTARGTHYPHLLTELDVLAKRGRCELRLRERPDREE